MKKSGLPATNWTLKALASLSDRLMSAVAAGSGRRYPASRRAASRQELAEGPLVPG